MNLGWMYNGQGSDGQLWHRSTAGNYVPIDRPMSLEDLNADFIEWQKKNLIVTKNDIKVDNASQIVVDPTPIETKS